MNRYLYSKQKQKEKIVCDLANAHHFIRLLKETDVNCSNIVHQIHLCVPLQNQ